MKEVPFSIEPQWSYCHWSEITNQHPSLPTQVCCLTVANLRSSFLCLTSMLLSRWSRQAYHRLHWKLWLSPAKHFINTFQALREGELLILTPPRNMGGFFPFKDKMYFNIYVAYCFFLPFTLISVFSVFVPSMNPMTLGSSSKFPHIASTAMSEEGRV